MSIVILSQNLINQIAAGEVVERPASVLKELLENALDAGATSIEVEVHNGGKTFLSVLDDGSGIKKEEIDLAFTRHATSKLPDFDLMNIHSFGFRGEALASIASIARVKMVSREESQQEGWEILFEGGEKKSFRPCPKKKGTLIEIRDLFFATPARLKFLKSDSTELSYIKNIVERFALSHPSVSFRLSDEKRTIFNFPGVEKPSQRFEAVLGKDFIQNLCEITADNAGMKLTGYVGLPTFNKATADYQYFFVNNRYIKDKIIYSAVRSAFQGLIPSDRYPVLILFLTVPESFVDVNVHPAKIEVRFQNASFLRSFIVKALEKALDERKGQTSSIFGLDVIGKMKSYGIDGETFPTEQELKDIAEFGLTFQAKTKMKTNSLPLGKRGYAIKNNSFQSSCFQQTKEENFVPSSKEEKDFEKKENFPPLGFAFAQIFKTYILSENEKGLVITDQHAADERLTYEKIQNQLKQNMPKQMLLIPVIVELKPDMFDVFIKNISILQEMGLGLEAFGENTIIVHFIPEILQKIDVKQMILDITDTLKEFEDTVYLKDKLKEICAKIACHGSVRAGRSLSIDEMNALLRKMEECPTSAQCIHGRPTYIQLERNDIERLFGRR